ncbi:MAG: response regulator, partial [Opitutaceae bacterium]|nr:response regulator [Opitutaceae bacterium]
MKILIIEDELEIRETLRDLLELNGHTVLVAIDGPMGVNLAAEQPDLILCDIGMPGMNGYQVITAIKALPAGQDIPFVFLTAWADREHQRQGMTLGADDYITKPFTQSDILDAIAARMQRLRPLRERILALLADRRVVAQANWANELLPPFNGIMGGLEMIEEAADYIKPAELKDLLKIIRTNAHQQFALSRKLALHYELERRKTPPCPEAGRCAASESIMAGAARAAHKEQRIADLTLHCDAASLRLDEGYLISAVAEL